MDGCTMTRLLSCLHFQKGAYFAAEHDDGPDGDWVVIGHSVWVHAEARLWLDIDNELDISYRDNMAVQVRQELS